MPFTDTGRNLLAFRFGSGLNSLYPQYLGIGSGSGTASVSDTTLLSEVNRVSFTTSPTFTTAKKVGFQADLNSFQMSGIHLTEFGLTHIGSNTGLTGSYWQREGFGSIVFDGTNELQITTEIEFA